MRGPSLLVSWAVLSMMAGCVQTARQSDDPNAIHVGVVLPFTGALSAIGTNAERAIILAAERVNAAGGVAARPIVLVPVDSHSNPILGAPGARELLAMDRVVAIIGPEHDDLAAEIIPEASSLGVLQVAGGTSSSQLTTELDDEGYWFRTVPPSTAMASAVADRLVADGIGVVSVIVEAGERGEAVGAEIQAAFRARGGVSLSPVAIALGRYSYAAQIQTTRAASPEAVVLLVPPNEALLILQEWEVLASEAEARPRWYFGPTLRSRAFSASFPAALITGSEDAVGIAPALMGDVAAFEEAFAARWDGERPEWGSFFYFDAMMLVALSLARAEVVDGSVQRGPTLRDAMSFVANEPGAPVSWTDPADALSRVASGEDVDYRGVAGSLDFDADGEVVQRDMVFWRIEEGSVVVAP